MNEQMNNQYPQQMVNQPIVNQVPNAVAYQAPVVKPKKTFKETIDDLKSKKVFMIAGIIAGVLMILGVFFPMITVKYLGVHDSTNLWDKTSIERFIVMLLGVVVILTFVFDKFKYLANVSAGASLMISITYFDSWFRLSGYTRGYTHLSLAFFVYVLAALVVIALNVLDNIDELLKLFNTKPKVVGPQVNFNNMTQVPVNQIQPTQVQSQANNDVYCTGCGNKKIGTENYCTNCGKQF